MPLTLERLMRKILGFLLFLIPVDSFAQQNLNDIRKKSWQTFVYRISASDAIQYEKWDSIPLAKFIDLPFFNQFRDGYFFEDKLPIGHYVLVSVAENQVKAELYNQSNLHVLAINNKQQLQLDIRTKEGKFINHVPVLVNSKPAAFNTSSQTYWVKDKTFEDATVIVFSTGDTLITYVTALDELRIPVSRQKRMNYHQSKTYKILNWVPKKILPIFEKKKNITRIGASGFIIFNQPKYKPLDTVKFKGYIVDKKWKQYSKQVDVYLNYYARGKYYNQLISTIKSVSAGAYTSQFIIADSIPVDISANLIFKNKKGKEIIKEKFRIEDYVLDEIGTQQFRSEKKNYFRNDSLCFFAGAKDANGLYVMDGSARLVLTTQKVDQFYQDTLFVADTLYDSEVKLKTDGDTKFVLPASDLPKADLVIEAKLIFKNANNELQEKIELINYSYQSKQIFVLQSGDSMKAVYMENGKEQEADGEMEMNYEEAIKIKYPFSIKIDPIAEEYSFYFNDKIDSLYKNIEVENNYIVTLSRISTKDTLGFVLENPYKIPVYFTVFNGTEIIASGRQMGESVMWKKVMKNRRQMYKVRWQYYWAGQETIKEESIGLLYKLLKIKISNDDNIFPGQKDSIKINVTDYLGQPAADVNLTAVSYNNQFKNDIRVKDPPYLVKYKSKKYIERDGFETDEANELILIKKYLLGNYTEWINKFGLDTMEYYKILFPPAKYYDAVTPIKNILPQVSVSVVNKGVPQEIYLLYINRQLAYYNAVTDRAKYAFEVFPENVQLGIRLHDKFIEIDSLYLQPYYKHDLSFDLNNLPAGVSVKPVDNFWSNTEMQLIEKSMWQMKNTYLNNNAYVWQGSSVVKLSGDRDHIAGPFRENEIMHFFSPNSFDISYNFEPGYQYNLSKQVLRLEKKFIFPKKEMKNKLPLRTGTLMLADTLTEPPAIAYPVIKKDPFLILTKDDFLYYYSQIKYNKGKIQIFAHKDSSIKYIVLKKKDTSAAIVLNGYNKTILNLDTGQYTLLLVSNSFYTASAENIMVSANGRECVKMEKASYSISHSVIVQLLVEANTPKVIKKITEKKEIEKISLIADSIIFTKTGGGFIYGVVKDKKGNKPISFCSIIIKGSKAGVQSDANGEYAFRNIRPGKYTFIISQIGYVSKGIEVEISKNETLKLDVLLAISEQAMQEVVVVGYGTQSKKSMTGSVSYLMSKELTDQNSNILLQGKVSGVQIQRADNFTPGADTKIILRGVNSITADNNPIYVIDGIIYTSAQNISPEMILDITVLQGAEAVTLYGSQASNGAIVITTNTKSSRKDFRDYAFWVPNFFTDKKGNAAVEVTYPDNVTGWKTYVVAMDKKRRMGKASVPTQSYKPMLAQLNLPLFLVEGDSSFFVTKSINYTNDKYAVKTAFTVNGSLLAKSEKELQPNDASTVQQLVSVNNADTVKASFAITSATGFKDAEERKIPVFKKGTEESFGNFWVLQKDTTVMFNAKGGVSSVNIYAQNNTLHLMLEELENLRRYSYYCMEQICSKITGLVLEKKIRMQLKQPFKNQGALDALLKKIQKAQQFDGGWAWWENGKSNLHITNYVAAALLQHRENPLVEANIRNAFLYLHNKLSFLDKNELLASLTTLSEGKHETDYATWINKINFDSINQHQQWQWIKIKQQQNLQYKAELDKLLNKKTTTMLGGVHWGTENYRWYSNEVATTILAFDVLKKELQHKNILQGIVQYFLEKRRNGYWSNTVETAGIINTILPTLLSEQENFNSPAQLSISGDTSFAINNFPYQLKINNPSFKNLVINKKGGGMVYFTAYQTFFNTDPKPVANNFIVNTSFKKNDQFVSVIKSGERVKMIINIEVLKDAEYVMLTIPIPAGCIFTNKTNLDWQVYKEYYKDKFILFAETLNKGMHQFEVELEPRYNGSYTLNPAKAALMYYPLFYGRNAGRKVVIK